MVIRCVQNCSNGIILIGVHVKDLVSLEMIVSINAEELAATLVGTVTNGKMAFNHTMCLEVHDISIIYALCAYWIAKSMQQHDSWHCLIEYIANEIND